jgi:hypothetical protein
VPRRLYFAISDLADGIPRFLLKPPFLVAALLVIAAAAGVPYARAKWFSTIGRTGTLRVESSRPGLAIRIDGVPRGNAPLTTELRPGRHRIEVEGAGRVETHDVDVPAGQETVIQAAGSGLRGTGAIALTTDPAGAEIWVDGVMYGRSPLTIPNVAEGQHTVLIRSPAGSVRRSIRVRGGETAAASVGIRPGYIAVFSPVRLDILEDGRPIGSTEAGRIPARAGDHTIEVVGASIGFRQTRRVEVRPGEVTALTIELPMATVEIVAPPDAEISIDGQAVGKTPLGPVAVAAGTHEILMRHLTAGEQRQVISVTYDKTNRVVFE